MPTITMRGFNHYNIHGIDFHDFILRAPGLALTGAPLPPRILVVEDDELTREFVMDLIDSFGYPVVAATNSLEAMRLIEEVPSITLVFTDIRMPGVDGIMLADMVKQHRPKLKILYTTGGSVVPRVRSEAGILHGNILAKPYRADDLRREIERILD